MVHAVNALDGLWVLTICFLILLLFTLDLFLEFTTLGFQLYLAGAVPVFLDPHAAYNRCRRNPGQEGLHRTCGSAGNRELQDR